MKQQLTHFEMEHSPIFLSFQKRFGVFGKHLSNIFDDFDVSKMFEVR